MPAAIAILFMVGLLAVPTVLYGAFTLFGVLIGQGIPIFMLYEFWFLLPMGMLLDFFPLGGGIIAVITWVLFFLIAGLSWPGFPTPNHLGMLIKIFFEHPFAVHSTAIQFNTGNEGFLNPGPRFLWAPMHFVQAWPFFNALDLIIMSVFYFVTIGLVLRFGVEKPIAALIAKAIGLKRFKPDVASNGEAETMTEQGKAMAT